MTGTARQICQRKQNIQNFNRFIGGRRAGKGKEWGKGVFGCESLAGTGGGRPPRERDSGLAGLSAHIGVILPYQQQQSKMAQALPVSLLTDLSPSAFLLRKTSSVPNICIHLDFSPSSPSPCPSPSSPASLPTFNSDGKHYTPSFILPCDEWRYSQHGFVYEGIHLRKSSEMQQQKSILLVPKPSRNNSYCCVCKTPFEDYLTHLNTPAHLILMRKSDYHLRIEDLCKGFGVQGAGATCGKKEGTGRKRGRPAKTKNICKLPALVCKRSLSGKETSDESNRVEDHAVQVMA